MSAAPDVAPAAAVPAAVEIEAPDISAYRDGGGWAPYVQSFDSGRAGPHATIVALMHGNEISGAVALHRLLCSGFLPACGRLSLVFANVAAYGGFDPANPGASRFVDEDMNRVWNVTRLAGDRDSSEARRARELLPLIDATDFLLDLHSMQDGETPLILAGPHAKGRDFARRLASGATIVGDSGHGNGTRLRDFGAFGDPASPRAALLAECGPHWRAGTEQIAIDTVYRFLLSLGMIGEQDAAPHLTSAVVPDSWVEVTHSFTPETEVASFVRPFKNLESIPAAGTQIATDGPRRIRTPHDNCVLIMPARRLVRRQTAVRLGRRMPFETGNGV